VDLEPLTKTLVFFRPVFGLGKASFRKLWEGLLSERRTLLSAGVEKEAVLKDRSLAMIVKDPPLSLSKAKAVIEYLRLNLGLDGRLYLPVQIIIDIGPFLRADKLELNDLRIPWEDIEPGRIYVSAPAFHVIKSRGAFHGVILPQGDDRQGFYPLFTGGDDKRKECLFLYQNAIVQGDLSPCFYCGDRRHTASRCPSKKMTETTNAISKMGYLPLEEVNKLFFRTLNENGFEDGPHHGDGADLNIPSFWAYYSFYELKSIYQLRLFRAVWNSREEEWNKIKEGRGEKNHGGLVWIAQDCIRVSHLEQAEAILRESLSKEPEDYKPLCALGFLHIEKDDLSQAKFYFKKALDRCHTTPQKIMVLFLLSRTYHLIGDHVRAEDMIRRILRYNPHCAEAVYEDILLQFRKGKEAIAVHQLMKLIRKNREYLIYAVIDPELGKFRELIHSKISALLHETREEAIRIAENAREELADLKKWLGDEERETQNAEGILSKIEELSKANSFFSHNDILHYGANLVGIGRSTLEERKRRISKILKELSERHERCCRYVRNFPYRFLVASISQELDRMHAQIMRKWGSDESGAPNKFKDMFQETERLSKELADIDAKLQRAEVIRRLILFLTRFLKKTLIFQSANLLVAIILFPIVTYYLGLLLPGLNFASHNIWMYQKSVLSLGAISGLLLALVTSGTGAGPKQVLQK
jgi:tetratricopeptide (TPR) repeat protein